MIRSIRQNSGLFCLARRSQKRDSWPRPPRCPSPPSPVSPWAWGRGIWFTTSLRGVSSRPRSLTPFAPGGTRDRMPQGARPAGTRGRRPASGGKRRSSDGGGLLPGTALVLPLPAPLSAPLQASCDGVAAPLSAAFCLREPMVTGLAPGEGVLAPDSKLLRAEEHVRVPTAREALRLATCARDCARTRHQHSSSEALAAWQALVAGRWTLLEHHESDGRRLLLARVNEAPAPAQGTLSAREAQVVAMVVQGTEQQADRLSAWVARVDRVGIPETGDGQAGGHEPGGACPAGQAGLRAQGRPAVTGVGAGRRGQTSER